MLEHNTQTGVTQTSEPLPGRQVERINTRCIFSGIMPVRYYPAVRVMVATHAYRAWGLREWESAGIPVEYLRYLIQRHAVETEKSGAEKRYRFRSEYVRWLKSKQHEETTE